MLDDDEGVADVAEVGERVDEPLVVALVQADRGLVEDVEDADEGGADLRREADALGLAAREGRRLALEGQVLEADVAHEGQAGGDLLQYLPGDLPLGVAQRRAGAMKARVSSTDLTESVVDADAAHRHGEGLGPEAPAAAGVAGLLAHEALEPGLDALALGLEVAALEVGEDAGEARLVLEAARALAVLVLDLDRLVGAVEDGVEHLLGQVLEGACPG